MSVQAMSYRPAALAGVAAALLSLGAGEFLGGVLPHGLSLVSSVGSLVIDFVPEGVKERVISLFGTHDKDALVGTIILVSVAFGAALGAAAMRRIGVAVVGFAFFGILAAYAALRTHESPPGIVYLQTVGAVAAGLWSLSVLLPRARAVSTPSPDPMARRSFLRAGGGVLALALVSGGLGRLLLEGSRKAAAGRESVVLPPPLHPAPLPPAGADLRLPGLPAVVTPNPEFYRIDTAISVPRVDLATWRLRLNGMVEHPLEFTYDQLLAMPLQEDYVTLTCVSNEVGGHLISNARWRGVSLPDLLSRAGPLPGATQIVGRSVDGFTVGFPTEAALDGRKALVAIEMNGEPLPLEHGFPARLVVAGLYGYVSATKWLQEIELTTLEAFDAYWVPRGWAEEAPIKTQSRIDVPQANARIAPGAQPIAGVAWAQDRGISRVEVQIDEGPWGDAHLADAINKDTWRQWVYSWNATPGAHRVRVRATDGRGQTQTSQVEPPAPDGASGYHTVNLRVT